MRQWVRFRTVFKILFFAVLALGIYFTIPFDAFFARSSTSTGTLAWSPLTRDGGARLSRFYQLYDLTGAQAGHTPGLLV